MIKHKKQQTNELNLPQVINIHRNCFLNKLLFKK